MAHDEFGGLTGWDLEGFHSGGDTEVWKRLGSHVVTIDDDERGPITGTRFAVWAPNAQAVEVISDFNWWTGDRMRLIPGSGVWGTFVEGVDEGTLYKFRIQDQWGTWHEKVDPMARYSEQAPQNASIVTETHYEWNDDEWIARREASRAHAEPMSVYEVHLGGWRHGLSYRELADQLVSYVTWQGYTHVEFMPLAEHPFAPSWGYQVTGYFSPTSRYGSPDDLRYLIDKLHQAGIGVIMDWVPGHFPKDDWALGRFDGTALYEHADPRQGEHKDWGTYIFNYGRNEVKSFLVSSALYWISEFHADGLRVDAVASMLYLDYSREEGQWVPNKYGGRENLEAIDFLRYVNSHLYSRHPGILMIAEESTSFPGVTKPVDDGGLGFGFKWNMGWMNDSLRYLELNPFHRQYHHGEMTFAMVYQYSENFILPISHDEVVHGKGSMITKIPGDDWQQFASLRAFYSYMWSFPGKQLVFMGQEFGQRHEFDESVSLEWFVADLWGHGGLKRLFRDLNKIYKENPALWQLDSDPRGFEWINADDAGNNLFSWLRRSDDGSTIACFTNFSPNPQTDYRIDLPMEGVWTEILNTDSLEYDGTGEFGNLGQIVAAPLPAPDRLRAVATVCVPPMGSVWLRHNPSATAALPGDPGVQ
ncbi:MULTISPECIES: 1,4-alpha-glucan branching protein GlgB [Cutibacterium]|jgi:1,4-alpha-glucan branching enzyme|uniref:1,4-alpha-glucan branching enzyme GlgB n=7 Tax=Bacteria TaxID=2 RepID=GLGB_CUTAK|nr:MULTISPECIES: 1,4-alpha-glucan branching protein GlgB [Cutibacterium]Q6A8Q7.1 RecName: Full=1,4-alpha-glucan branching enzyme GlgB; AltName: Full=1,4-alpha-D-glucan:1,4-alpha-D-glucan 6-glucosyl-transferase; AltName: Full=Alpha-(1->4)-glucan branching enzyme; AltName: Full=Glycogen branching enzyme; Short=BE [Cutibacterium acnes KPA171202]EGL41162.1 1,4-alpha-glucan branching enzyme [Propionibacterium sp. 434-HC2]EGL44023.1 1,4-alpha-glucan branching enzyme [Propionibacterium sp. 409-HC1]EGR